MELFDEPQADQERRPLAERMRPANLKEYLGQDHLLAEGSLLVAARKAGRLFSLILWGPPGVGKTTLARLLAQETDPPLHFLSFSAVLSGIKEIKAALDTARERWRFHRERTVVFIDEIHRFNKAQQDALLPHVETGEIILIGATTENPSFEVISPLLSRLRVFILQPLSEEALRTILLRAIADQERGLGRLFLNVSPEALSHLVKAADGDARAALNNLEAAAEIAVGRGGNPTLSLADIQGAIQRKALLYDKNGEEHYNLISAFHKSMRGGDPDGALYWLGRMLAGGEDPLYIARRMVRFASEDVGNADPRALEVAVAAMEAFRFIGRPEGELALAQAAVYLACAEKSNALYVGWGKVQEAIDETGSLPVPLHLRNAPTALMKGWGYGRGYKYAHDYKDAWVSQEYLPEPLAARGDRFYVPSGRGGEREIEARRLRQEKKPGRS